MRKNKLATLMLVAALAASSLAGCGSSAKEPAETQAQTQATEAAAPATTAALETKAEEEPTPTDEVQKGGILTVVVPSSPKTVDPKDHTTDYEADIIYQVAQNLVTYNKEYTDIIPLLATEWSVSEDGKDYTFKLRDDVYFQPGKFQDGRQMVAEDVKYSLERIYNECPTDRICRDFFESVEVVNDFEVIIHLKDSCGPFLETLCDIGNGILPKEEVEGWGDEFGYHLVGTGPFMLEEMVADESVTLKKNPNYWGDEPNVDGVVIKTASDNSQIVNALVSDEAHIGMYLQGESIQRAKDAGLLVQSPATSVTMIRFNMQNGPTADPKVREAIIKAINIDDMVKGIYQYGEASRIYQPLTFLSWGYNDEYDSLVPTYDPEAAKQLLAEAGYPDGFTMTMYIGSSTNREKMAQLFQYYLGEVGITVDIQSSAMADWMSAVTGSWKEDVVNSYGITFNGTLDPYAYEDKFFISNNVESVSNAGGYNDEEVDEWLYEAYKATDHEERTKYYNMVMEKVMKDNVGIFYACEARNWGVSEKVHDSVLRADSRLLICTPFNNIWIEQ